MNRKKDADSASGSLRGKAEQIVRGKNPDTPANFQKLSAEEVGRLVHELRVYQVELEVQNEELREAQQKLEEVRARYFELYNLAPVGYFSISEKGIILEANLTGANMLGILPCDLGGQPFSNFVLKEDRDIYYLHRTLLFKKRKLQACELRMVGNGSQFWAQVQSDLSQDVNEGKPVCHLTMSDITPRKQADELLRASEEKYRLLVENAMEAIFIAAGGTLKFANGRTSVLTGYSQEELLSWPFADFIYHDDREMVTERHWRRLKDEAIPNVYPFRIVCKDGHVKWVELSTVPIVWEGGPATLNFLQDITDRKRVDEERQRVEKLESVGVLAGGIAHDFNNILTAILGNISLARMEAAPGSEIQESLEQAEKASLRAKGLTKQLLTFSTGGAPVRKVSVITDLIRDTAGFALRGSNVKFQFPVADGLWYADIDEGQVSQVIHNLVINAQQAMPAGGTIEIAAENMAINDAYSLDRGLPLKAGDYVRITVTDHGSGIAAEHMEKLFDPFFTTKKKGSGLGLAVSFSIARQHGGHLSAVSEPGSGSTFYLYLPAFRQMAAPEHDKQAAVKSAGGVRILVMDDEESVRKVAGRMLNRLGYEAVEFAADGAAAVKLYEVAMKSGNPFSVVILDLTVPGGMGGEVAVRLLSKMDPAVKAIVSSGYIEDSAMAKYREYGFCGMVAKPYTSEELGKAVQEVISEG